MALSQQTLPELQQVMVEAYSSQASIPADTDPGSQVGAILNAPVLPLGMLQQQIAYVYAIARLSTIPANTNGTPNPDVDSFVSPFGLTRLGPNASTGQVTFSTSSPVSAQLLIPVGVVVQTSGGLNFTVQTGGTGYDSVANGYWIAAGTSSVTVPVQCVAGGTQGNVQANTVTQILAGPGYPPIAGATTVTNTQAFTNGTNYETDAALKTRFTNFVSTGTVGTQNALRAAILGVAANLTYSLADGTNASGASQAAYFTVVVNTAGASTAPGSTLLNAVAAAVDAVRSAGISRSVIGPSMVSVAVTGTIKVAPGFTAASVATAAQSAVTAYINSIGLDPSGSSTTCSVGKVYATLFGVQGVQNADFVQLNAGTVDLTEAFAQMFTAGTISFTTV